VSVTLVTGATGFIGSHVARLLVERGDNVRVTVRPSSLRDNLTGLDVQYAECDVLDRRQVRKALKGVDRLFHVAGSTSLRRPAEEMFRINAEGATIVLEEALRAGVERVVYTSSIAAIGPAFPGSTADESQVFHAGHHGLPYLNSKHEGEREALRLAAAGLPVVIVNPAHVLGRGDVYRSSTEIVRRFLRRELPAYVDSALCVVDVEDVARGHLLAEEKGNVGERYILGNRNYTLDRLFADLGRISGVEPPAVKLPVPLALAFARTVEALPGRPVVTEAEVRLSSLWWAFRSNKAKRELGYKPRHQDESLEHAIAWYREREPLRVKPSGTRQPAVLRATGFAFTQGRGIVAKLGF
jgi:dihydroflavonol-4-reductase